MRRALVIIAGALAITAATAANADDTDPNAAITSKVELNDVLAMPLSNGCHYVATIRGTVTPVRDSASKSKSGTVDSSIAIDVSLLCPMKAAVRAVENVREHGPLTLGQLERMLEQRASIVSDASGRRCVYRPDLFFVSGRLESGSVVLDCPK